METLIFVLIAAVVGAFGGFLLANHIHAVANAAAAAVTRATTLHTGVAAVDAAAAKVGADVASAIQKA